METVKQENPKQEIPKDKKKNQKDSAWLKPRHKTVRNLVSIVLSPYSAHKYGIKVEKFKEQNGRQYLILFNHQTAFDQFFVGEAFKGPIYYLATEDIFSKGWVSSLIRYLVAPIPIKKQTSDIRAIKNCLKVAKEGGTIALAPEGNRTYSGKTEFMLPTIAFLAKEYPEALPKRYGIQLPQTEEESLSAIDLLTMIAERKNCRGCIFPDNSSIHILLYRCCKHHRS